MQYSETQIKGKLNRLIESSSWEQILFALSQLALDLEDEADNDENPELASIYTKLSNDLHDLSNLMG